MKVAVSIDIGGTNTKLALVDQNYQLLRRSQLPTLGYGSVSSYLNTVFNHIRKLASGLDRNYEIEGIGIGTPCANTRTKMIEGAANISFLNDQPITTLFESEFGVPTQLINDGNAAALGEGIKGAAQGMSNYILITLGTGLGCGIVVEGKVAQGVRGMAGEFGHVIAQKGGRQCACGAKGCLETYTSASGLKRTVFELMADLDQESILRSISFEQMSAKQIYEAALKGDPIALKAFDFTGMILGEKLADLVTLFEPQAIFLTGGLASAADLFLEATIAGARKNVLPIYRSTIHILISSLAVNEAALYGAASLVFEHQKQVVL